MYNSNSFLLFISLGLGAKLHPCRRRIKKNSGKHAAYHWVLLSQYDNDLYQKMNNIIYHFNVDNNVI